MNIKLGTEVHRVRLEQSEFESLSRLKILSQDFSVTEEINFTVIINFQNQNTPSQIKTIRDIIIINLSSVDYELLSRREWKKGGIVLGNFHLQVDNWSNEQRGIVQKNGI